MSAWTWTLILAAFITGAYLGGIYPSWRTLARQLRYLKRRVLRRSLSGDIKLSRQDTKWHDCVVRFSRRYAIWSAFAVVSLVAAIVSVLAGLLIFLFATRISSDSTLTSKEKERNLLQERFNGLSQQETLTEIEADDWQTIQQAWGSLRSPVFFVEDFAETSNDATELNRQVEQHSRYRSMLARLRFDVGLTPDDQVSIESIEEFKRMVNDAQLVENDFTDAYKKCLDQFRRKSAQSSNESQVKEALRNLWGFREEFQKVEKKIRERKESIAHGQNPSQRKRQAERRIVQANLQQVDEEILTLRQQFDPNSLSSVVPILVIRIAAVILLIFLTQLFLSVYRYNIRIASHYASIGDAVALAYPSETTKEELASLVATLSPKTEEYMPPDSPLQQLSQLLNSVRRTK